MSELLPEAIRIRATTVDNLVVRAAAGDPEERADVTGCRFRNEVMPRSGAAEPGSAVVTRFTAAFGARGEGQ